MLLLTFSFLEKIPAKLQLYFFFVHFWILAFSTFAFPFSFFFFLLGHKVHDTPFPTQYFSFFLSEFSFAAFVFPFFALRFYRLFRDRTGEVLYIVFFIGENDWEGRLNSIGRAKNSSVIRPLGNFRRGREGWGLVLIFTCWLDGLLVLYKSFRWAFSGFGLGLLFTCFFDN